MMNVAKNLVLVALFWVTGGFSLLNEQLQPKVIYHVVSQNQTLWEVCQMYAYEDRRSKTLDEFVYNVRMENGGNPIVQPGQKLKITLWQPKKEAR